MKSSLFDCFIFLVKNIHSTYTRQNERARERERDKEDPSSINDVQWICQIYLTTLERRCHWWCFIFFLSQWSISSVQIRPRNTFVPLWLVANKSFLFISITQDSLELQRIAYGTTPSTRVMSFPLHRFSLISKSKANVLHLNIMFTWIIRCISFSWLIGMNSRLSKHRSD